MLAVSLSVDLIFPPVCSPCEAVSVTHQQRSTVPFPDISRDVQLSQQFIPRPTTLLDLMGTEKRKSNSWETRKGLPGTEQLTFLKNKLRGDCGWE